MKAHRVTITSNGIVESRWFVSKAEVAAAGREMSDGDSDEDYSVDMTVDEIPTDKKGLLRWLDDLERVRAQAERELQKETN